MSIAIDSKPSPLTTSKRSKPSARNSPKLDPALEDYQAIRLTLATKSLKWFGRSVYPNFEAAPHHQAIIDALEKVERGTIRRLILQIPPRHGKSTLASLLFPPWYLGRAPSRRVIACSYSVDLAYEFSRGARAIIRGDDYGAIFPDVRLAPDVAAVSQWGLVDAKNEPHAGGYVSAGVGGGIVGKGCDVALVDDPLKNAEEASSATIRQSIRDWYRSTLYTRLEGEGAVILVMSRWNEDDLAGSLISEQGSGGDQWTVIHLPAVAEENDALGRNVGEALWPEKFNEADLARIRTVAGSRDFNALYQQRPSPPGGSLFKRDWWQYYRDFDRSQAEQIIQVWDTAFKAKERSDYSVCSTWALTTGGAYVLDVFRERIEFPELKRKAIEKFERWQPSAVLVEDRASGQSLIQDLQRSTRLPVIPTDVDSDKVSRAAAVTPYVEAGRVFLPESAPWVDEWVEEHAAFPDGAHDDQVDNTSMALRRLFVARTVIKWA